MIKLNDIGAAAFVVVRRGDAFVYDNINTAAEQMTGLARGSTVGRTLEEIFSPEMAAMLATNYDACMSSRQTVEFNRVIKVPLGELATRTTLTPLFTSQDDVVDRLLGVTVDVTEQHRLEDDLKRTNARLAIAMEAVGGAHWYFDLESRRFELSPALTRLLGFGTGSTLGMDEWLGHVHPDDRDDTCFADILAGRAEQGVAEFRVLSTNGDIRWLRCRRGAIQNSVDLVGIAGVVLDITQDKRREAALSHQAASDPLTGLPNRRRFDEVFSVERERAILRQGPLSLLIIDVDHFKLYNDAYGHIAGDAVLRRVAKSLESAVGASGGLVARFGGEEFIAVLPGLDTVAAAKLADDMLQAVADLGVDHEASPTGTLTVSIGISGQPRMTRRPVDLVALADVALYRAKGDGRGCYRVMVPPRLQAIAPVLESTAA